MRNMLLRNKDGLTEKEFLESYRPGNYEKPSNTVDMLLFTVDDKPADNVQKMCEKELKILLIKRGNHPYMDCFAIPGGFVNIDEALNEAAYRELKEETSIENIYLEQLYTWGDDVKRDPRMRVISISYMALVDKNNIKPKAGDDASDVKWFSVKKKFMFSIKEKDVRKDIYNLILTSDDEENKIVYKVTEKYIKNGIMPNKKSEYEPLSFSKEELAFDHVKIIDTALERLKIKIEYTPIAFMFLPKRFTLTKLQEIYEVILNRTLLKENFIKKILPMVKKTDCIKENADHSFENYYEFNKDWNYSFLNE